MNVREFDWQEALGGVVQPGDVLDGRYRVDGAIGAGGMGVVLLGWHVVFDDRVAIKVLHPRRVDNVEARSRFEREARATFQIRSGHVARVLDIGSLAGGVPFMVLEHLQGRTLAELLAEQGPLEIPRAVAYVLQASDAVAEAHALGIVHRDLKPANLFLAERADGAPFIKVLDFGLAKADDYEGTLTVGDRTMGTPRYMSPEQWVSARDVGPATDVWALGVSLFELLTGTGPFPGDDVEELCQQVLSGQPRSVASLCPDVPPALDSAIARCLQRNPKNRFPSVPVMATALASAAGLPAGATMVAPSAGGVSLAEPTQQTLGEPSGPGREAALPVADPTRATATAAAPPDEDPTHQYHVDDLAQDEPTVAEPSDEGRSGTAASSETGVERAGADWIGGGPRSTGPSSGAESAAPPVSHAPAAAARAGSRRLGLKLALAVGVVVVVVLLAVQTLRDSDDPLPGGLPAATGGGPGAGGAARRAASGAGGGGDDLQIIGQQHVEGVVDAGPDGGRRRTPARYRPPRRKSSSKLPEPWDLR